MPNYRRAFVAGGCWFFTVNLLDRRRSLLTDHVPCFTGTSAQEYSRPIGPAKWKNRETSASANSGCTAEYAALIRPTLLSFARVPRVPAKSPGSRRARRCRVHAEAGDHALGGVRQHAVDVAFCDIADVHLDIGQGGALDAVFERITRVGEARGIHHEAIEALVDRAIDAVDRFALDVGVEISSS